MIPNLIALCGRKRSGKDFLLQGLIADSAEVEVIERLSFSDGLRDIAHSIYPWLPARIPDELKDVPYAHRLNPRNLSPRGIWLHLGSEQGLRYVQPDIFLRFFIDNCMRDVSENITVKYVITDVRTKAEYDWIKANHIKLIRISKPCRQGIVEDEVENFIDEMEVDHEFVNDTDGAHAFIDFYRNNEL